MRVYGKVEKAEDREDDGGGVTRVTGRVGAAVSAGEKR